MTKPKRLARTVIYENPWVNLYVDKVAFPGGRIIEQHHILEFDKQAVAVLVENEQGHLLFVEAYRYPTDSIEWEIPAGGVDPNESILATAQREVQEETGYASVDHTLVYTFNPLNGMSNKVFHIVRCRATTHNGVFDQNEVRSYRWFARQEIEQMLRDQVIHDGFTLVGLLFYLGQAYE